MHKTRVWRNFMVGWAFILSTVLHFWIFGGRPSLVLSLVSERGWAALLALLVALVSAPLLGYMLAPLGSGLLHLFSGRGIDFKYPRDEKAVKAYFAAIRARLTHPFLQSELDALQEGFLSGSGRGASRTDLGRLHTFFNYAIRCRGEEGLGHHVVRHFTNFWTHFNILIGVAAGAIGGLLLKMYVYRRVGEILGFTGHPSYFLYELPFLALYLLALFFHLRRSLAVAREIEYLSILNQ